MNRQLKRSNRRPTSMEEEKSFVSCQLKNQASSLKANQALVTPNKVAKMSRTEGRPKQADLVNLNILYVEIFVAQTGRFFEAEKVDFPRIILTLDIVNYLLLVIPVLVSVAFLTLIERKILGLAQARKGPNKVSLTGVLQPGADAIKLFLKEGSYITQRNFYLFLLSPTLTLFLVLWG